MKLQVFLGLFMALYLLTVGCEGPLNNNPPEYIEDVVAYKRGIDGVEVYFVLADKNGAETRSDGEVTLSIYEGHDISIPSITANDEFLSRLLEIFKVYSHTITVRKVDFQRTQVGTGASEHKRTVCSLGRISFDQFIRPPLQRGGTVVLQFETPTGRVLLGGATFLF